MDNFVDPKSDWIDSMKFATEEPTPKPDMVNTPPHYIHGGIETIDLIEAMLTPEEFRGYLKGTIYAYRERAPYKGTMDLDYDKALWYWNRLNSRKIMDKEALNKCTEEALSNIKNQLISEISHPATDRSPLNPIF